MKYCMKCKKGLSNGSSYCPFCGGGVVDAQNVKGGVVIKVCKKCDKNYPPQYKYCPFCGSPLTDKDTFWDDKIELGIIKLGDNKRFIVEKTIKNGNEFVSISRQFFDGSVNEYRYKKSIAVPIECVGGLLDILGKSNN